MKTINKFYDGFTMAVMGLMAVAVIVTVFLRYGLNITFAWAEEAITFIFIATTYLGVVIAVREKEHIAIDYVVKKSPPWLALLLKLFKDGFILWLHYIIFTVSLNWIDKVGNVVAPSLRIPMKYFYYMMPASACLVSLAVVIRMITTIRQFGISAEDQEESDERSESL